MSDKVFGSLLCTCVMIELVIDRKRWKLEFYLSRETTPKNVARIRDPLLLCCKMLFAE